MIWLPGSSALSSPLLKIPLLCSAVSLVVLAQTPPTPAPSADEKARYGPRKQTKLVSRKTTPYIVRTVHGANLICECAVICCARFPSHLADTLQSFLIRRPFHTAHDVRITPWWLTGCLLMSAGGILRLTCYRTLGRLFTWEPSIQNDHVLITSGPYAVVRHPAYLGSLMVAIGAVVYAVCPGSWFYECVGWDTWWGKAFAVAWTGWQLLVPTVLMARVNREDKILRENFGAEWERYAERTKYKLIPGIY